MKKLLFFLPLFFLAPLVHAISFDATSSSTYTSASTIASSLNVGVSCTNDLVMATLGYVTSTQPSSVLIGGKTATLAVEGIMTNRATTMWYATGTATGLINVTTTFAATHTGGLILASYCDVNQTTPVDVTSSNISATNNTTPTGTITTTIANDWILDSMAVPGTANSIGIGAQQTVVASSVGVSVSGARNSASYMLKAVAGVATTSWTLSGAQNWAEIITAVRPTVATTVAALTPHSSVITFGW